MGGGMRLGKILGFEIALDYSWFLVFFMVTWSLATNVFPSIYGIKPDVVWPLAFSGAVLLFGSVIIHELSHAILARRHGMEVQEIVLFLFGGVARLKGEPPTPKAEFLIAAAGPATSAVLGVLCWGASWTLSRHAALHGIAALVNYVGVMNIILAVFNLVPGFPMDGGRILRSAIWQWTGSLRKATRWASNLGQAFGCLLMAYGLFQVLSGSMGGLWPMFVGWFLRHAARSAYEHLLLQRALRGVPLTDVMTYDLPGIDSEMRIPEFVQDYLLKHEHVAYPVSYEGDYVGVITLEDVRNLDRSVWGVTCVGALAHAPEEERVVQDSEDAWRVLNQMLENDVPRLLVMHDGQLSGTVSRESLGQLIQSRLGRRQAV